MLFLNIHRVMLTTNCSLDSIGIQKHILDNYNLYQHATILLYVNKHILYRPLDKVLQLCVKVATMLDMFFEYSYCTVENRNSSCYHNNIPVLC